MNKTSILITTIVTLGILSGSIFAYQLMQTKPDSTENSPSITNTTEQKTTNNQNPIKQSNKAEDSTKDFCINNTLGIRLPYNKNQWTCKSREAKNENDIAELFLTKDKIVITFSNGDRGESCLSCESKTNIVSNDFVTLNKYFNSTEGNIITYFGSLFPSINGWVVVSRTPGMENVYGADFNGMELKEIATVLSPVSGKN